METKCQWAARLFNDWKTARNRTAIMTPDADISVIRTELVEMSKDEINYCVSRFITEVKKKKRR